MRPRLAHDRGVMDKRRDLDPGAIHLADELPFEIGALEVRPATREVARGGVVEVLEPRVMQVLVALAQAGGHVVSHHALIERAWSGQVVGEGSIHRVVSRLRRLEATIGAGCFALETVVKVGYRLSALDSPTTSECRATEIVAELEIDQSGERNGPKMDRRVLLGGAAVGLTALAAGVWRPGARRAAAPEPSGSAEGMIAAGNEALRRGLPEEDEQAVAYFRRAIELAPRSSEAWAGLALGHVQLLSMDIADEDTANAARAREAARTALALDPGNTDAQTALILIRPSFRNWLPVEAELRGALRRHPGNARLQTALGDFLVDVGRPRAAILPLSQAIEQDPRQYFAQTLLAYAEWSTGAILRADKRFEQNQRLWPRHRQAWVHRLTFLSLTGRASAALATIADVDARPTPGPREAALPLAMYAACATALATRTEATRARALDLVAGARARGVVASYEAALYFASLGRNDSAFELLDRYYFGGGGPDNIRGGPRPLSRRVTVVLFLPPAAPLRRDPRFGVLTRRLGVEGYWRASGARPDYRG